MIQWWHLLLQLLLFLAASNPHVVTARIGSSSSWHNSTAAQQQLHRRLLSAQSRIVGGSPVASTNEFPGFVYWNQGCGGTLILPQIVLTAAHCHLGLPGIIRVGSIDREEGTEFEVAYVRIHPAYNGNRDDPDWDYMILKLKQPVPADLATPVQLNTDPTLPSVAGEELVAVGFGRLREGGKEDSDSLQKVTLPYVTNEACFAAYASPRINEAALCAGEAGLDACQGDSGGPLFAAANTANAGVGGGSAITGNLNNPLQQQPPPQQLQVGIVSWGLGCARPGFPGVYARTSTGFDWIQAQACFHVDEYDEEFCQGAHVPIGMSLEVDMLLDETLYQNYSWGLYYINTSTTLYESEQDPYQGGVIELVNTASSTQAISVIRRRQSRKKEEEEDEEEDEEEPEPEEVEEEIFVEQLPPNARKLQWTNLPTGTYYFTLRNPFGTGLIGAGNRVIVTQGGGRRRVVKVPHNFESFYNQYFTISNQHLISDIRQQRQDDLNNNGTVTPTVELMIDVFYDANPNETGWELRNLNTTEVLAVVSIGSISPSTHASTYESYTYTVERGYTYQLSLWDAAGNGMAEGGWLSLWIGNVMEWKSDEIVNGGTTVFTYQLTHTFDL